MIKYELICKDCSHKFSSWFASSKEFEKIKKIKMLTCGNCNSLNIDKSLMAPSLLNTKKTSEKKEEKKLRQFKNKLKEYQNFIKNNFKYVGDNFAYEARSIHYDRKKTKKGIYGNATEAEVKELKDEGIETEMIPWVKDVEN